MEKRNEGIGVKSGMQSGAKSDELSIADVLSEQASELPEKALMRRHGHHSYYHYDYCYPYYDYCYYPYGCYGY